MCSADSSTSTTSWPGSPSGSLWRPVPGEGRGHAPMTTASANRAPRVTGTGSPRGERRSEVLGDSPDQTRRPKLIAVSATEVLVPHTTCGQYKPGGVDHAHPRRPARGRFGNAQAHEHPNHKGSLQSPVRHATQARGRRNGCGAAVELSVKSETSWLPGLAANGAGRQVSDRPSGTGGDD